MAGNTQGTKLEFSNFHLAVRYRGIFFPFELQHFIVLLPQLGYVVTKDVPSLPVGARIRASGEIARKGDVELRLMTDMNVVALQSRSMEALIAELGILEDFLQEQLVFDSRGQALFYELMGDVVAVVDGRALRTIEQHFENTPLMKRLGEIMGQRVTNFTLRLVPPGQRSDGIEWLDLKIEPQVINPESKLAVSVVYRSLDRAKVMEFGKKLSELVQRIVGELERKE